MNWNLVFTIVLALTPIHLLLIWVGLLHIRIRRGQEIDYYFYQDAGANINRIANSVEATDYRLRNDESS